MSSAQEKLASELRDILNPYQKAAESGYVIRGTLSEWNTLVNYIASALIEEGYSKAEPQPSTPPDRPEIQEIHNIIVDSMNQYTGTNEGILDAAETIVHRYGKIPEVKESVLPPDRWCILRTPENADMVNGWFNEKFYPRGPKIFMNSHKYLHNERCTWIQTISHHEPADGFTLITDQQFRLWFGVKEHVYKCTGCGAVTAPGNNYCGECMREDDSGY